MELVPEIAAALHRRRWDSVPRPFVPDGSRHWSAELSLFLTLSPASFRYEQKPNYLKTPLLCALFSNKLENTGWLNDNKLKTANYPCRAFRGIWASSLSAANELVASRDLLHSPRFIRLPGQFENALYPGRRL